MYHENMKRVQILGVAIDALTMRQAVAVLRDMLAGGKHHVMTPNSEMLVRAQKDDSFRSLLNSADLNLPDSAGLLWAAKVTGQELPERVPGVDTVTELCSTLPAEHPVFFLGAKEGVAEKAARQLMKHNPNLTVAGAYSGSPSKADAPDIIKRINDSGAHLLLVAYGAPAQDVWINQHLLSLTTVRVAMGVGGTFDFLAGTVKRAPAVMRKAGLEWLWRLLLQPWRVGRIFTATVVFPLLVLLRKNR